MKLLLPLLLILLSAPALLWAQDQEEPQRVTEIKEPPQEEREEAPKKNIQRQEARDPLGEFNDPGNYDTGNGTTTNQKVNWPDR